jgi:hypothetical protein
MDSTKICKKYLKSNTAASWLKNPSMISASKNLCNLWSIKNAGLLGPNRLYTKYYRLTTKYESLRTKK